MIKYFAIVPEHNRVVCIVRDNKIIGRCSIWLVCDSIVTVEGYNSNMEDMFPDAGVHDVIKHMPHLDFNIFTGKYDDFVLGEGRRSRLRTLRDVRAVDECNLYLGMVPRTFKEVEGYASNVLQFEKLCCEPGYNKGKPSYAASHRRTSAFVRSMNIISPSIGLFL